MNPMISTYVPVNMKTKTEVNWFKNFMHHLSKLCSSVGHLAGQCAVGGELDATMNVIE